MTTMLVIACLVAAIVLPHTHAYPLTYFGFWQNNSTQTASFTNFAFWQDTPAALIADYELGVTGLWFLEYVCTSFHVLGLMSSQEHADYRLSLFACAELGVNYRFHCTRCKRTA